jgi:septum formation protein
MSQKFQLILASSSPRRLELLKSLAITPDQIISPSINEEPLRHEKPDSLAVRLAKAKAIKVAIAIKGSAFILAADTIVGTKARVFEKADNNETVKKYLQFFSGRKIYIKTAIAVVKLENGKITKTAAKLVTSTVKFKRISPNELEYYLKTGKGIGVAGGFSIQGFGEALVQELSGSYSGIIGLPLRETIQLLEGLGCGLIKS